MAGRCQTKPNLFPRSGSLGISGGELAPFGQRDSAVLFEDVATVEVTILIKVIVD
jgi:hypothetical protein